MTQEELEQKVAQLEADVKQLQEQMTGLVGQPQNPLGGPGGIAPGVRVSKSYPKEGEEQP